MHSSRYLYNIDATDLKAMEYTKALNYKKVKGIALYRELFLKPNRTFDEDERMHYVEKAVRHTTKLIEEVS